MALLPHLAHGVEVFNTARPDPRPLVARLAFVVYQQVTHDVPVAKACRLSPEPSRRRCHCQGRSNHMQPASKVPHATHAILFAIALAISLTAGLPFSPYFDTILFWLGKMAGPAWAASPGVFYGTTAILMLATLSIAAIAGAIARWLASRWIGRTGQLAIWCAAALAIAWPALRIAVGLDH